MLRDLISDLGDIDYPCKEYFLRADSDMASISIIAGVFLLPPMSVLDYFYNHGNPNFYFSVLFELLFAIFSIMIVYRIRHNALVETYEKLVFIWSLATSIFALLATILQPQRIVENMLFTLLFFIANFLVLNNRLLYRLIPIAIIIISLITALLTNNTWFTFADKYMFSLTFLIIMVIGLTIVARNSHFKTITFSLQNSERQKRLSYEALAIEKSHLFELLQKELVEHRLVEDEVRLLNTRLEQRVSERTVELETAIRELESFSYTVGHDLRAPLRGIHGFSKMIIEDFGDSLPADVHDRLGRVEGAAKTMGELVDALLDFSRLTRSSFHRVEFNLSELVSELFQDIGRPNVGFSVTEGLVVSADPVLTRMLVRHLLDNAVKFTSTIVDPQIKFGVLDQNGAVVYFIQDNGVGFNMDYAQKLFQPFQKLHHPSEFPGNGIGLVTAQRITQRHGGRIWAAAEPYKGATFFFTLG